MKNQPATRLIDISRIVSRAGRTPTGIDRVEYAYLRRLAHNPETAFGIARTALGYVLLDKSGMNAFCALADQGNWPRPDLVSRLNWRLTDAARIGQTAVRKLAIRRSSRSRLHHLLKDLPGQIEYINVGHSNLSKRTLSTISAMEHASISVMIHDAIPLDYPQFQKAGSVERYSGMLARVSRYADRVICISNSERARIEQHLSKMLRIPKLVVAPLGLDEVASGPIPEALRNRPFFMTVGTIEPRKNHALLLDVWKRLGPDAPTLVICGSRGWVEKDVLDRLDRGIPGVLELANLSDETLRGMMENTAGFLFPSFAEGYGLPPVEAAAAGSAVLCSDLPSCKEILGDKAVYLDPTDSYQWEKAVKALIGAKRQKDEQPFATPTWDAHFKTVFTIM